MLSRLRAEAGKFLPDTATIYRPSMTADGAGGQQKTLTVVGIAPARLAFSATYAGDRRPELAAAGGRASYWRIVLPAGTDVRRGDVVEIRGRQFQADFVSAGGSYEIYVVVGGMEL